MTPLLDGGSEEIWVMPNMYLRLINWGDGLTPSNDGNRHLSVYV
jgi:hypothetical protein